MVLAISLTTTLIPLFLIRLYMQGLLSRYRLIAESFEHLKKGGSLQVVLRPKLGGKRLAKKMETIFDNVETSAKKEFILVISL